MRWFDQLRCWLGLHDYRQAGPWQHDEAIAVYIGPEPGARCEITCAKCGAAGFQVQAYGAIVSLSPSDFVDRIGERPMTWPG